MLSGLLKDSAPPAQKAFKREEEEEEEEEKEEEGGRGEGEEEERLIKAITSSPENGACQEPVPGSCHFALHLEKEKTTTQVWSSSGLPPARQVRCAPHRAAGAPRASAGGAHTAPLHPGRHSSDRRALALSGESHGAGGPWELRMCSRTPRPFTRSRLSHTGPPRPAPQDMQLAATATRTSACGPSASRGLPEKTAGLARTEDKCNHYQVFFAGKSSENLPLTFPPDPESRMGSTRSVRQ